MSQSNSLPSLRRHKASGRGIATLSGHDVYCGLWPVKSKRPPHEVKAAYDAAIAKWLAAGRRWIEAEGLPPPFTVAELVAKHAEWATAHYPEVGKGRGESVNYRHSTRELAALFGPLPVANFGPKALKEVRARMLAAGTSRREINKRVGRCVRVFKWGVAEELVPEATWRALTAVTGLKEGEAPEPEAVPPVTDEDVEATLPHLPAEVAGMVRFQRFTGARPGEVCRMLACDIDRTGNVWLYRPAKHKTKSKGKGRVIAIGPRAQEAMLPFLRVQCPLCGACNRPGRIARRAELCGPCADRGECGPWPVVDPPGDYQVFSPAEARIDRFAAMRAGRKSKVQPSQANRKRASPKQRPGEAYTPNTYANAITRACKRAGVEAWSPNQLRHSRATEIRKAFGLEAAQVALGHARADVTQIYAERDLSLAVEVAEKSG